MRDRDRLILLMESLNDRIVGVPVVQWMREAATALKSGASPALKRKAIGSMDWIADGACSQSAHVKELARDARQYMREDLNA